MVREKRNKQFGQISNLEAVVGMLKWNKEKRKYEYFKLEVK